MSVWRGVDDAAPNRRPAECGEAEKHWPNRFARNDLLLRLFDGDPLASADLRAAVREALPKVAKVAPRTGGDLLARAEGIRAER
jgi:hypothetical protein